MKPDRRNIALGTLALLWLVLVFVLYYASHKPFTPEVVVSLAAAAWNLLTALAVLSLAGGLGRKLLGEYGRPLLVRLALQAALGLGVLSLAALIVGATLGTHSLVAWLGLLLTGFLLRREIIGWWRSWSALKVAWEYGGRLGKILGILSGLILGFSILTALAPPVKFDALVYHLALPRAYLQAGKVTYFPWNFFWGMPQLAEMLYTWSMRLAGDRAAASLGWSVGVVALAGILGLAQERYGAQAAWVAMASLLAGVTTASGLGWAYVEWFTILFGAAFLAASQTALDNQKTAAWILPGVFAGFALGSKYTAGALLLAGVGAILWEGRNRYSLSKIFRQSALFLVTAVVVSLPWLIKNLAATGNPIYPFLFPSGAVNVYRMSLYQSLPAWGDWRDFFLLPIRATVLGYEGAPGYAAAAGPLLLGLGLIYPLRRWLRVAPALPAAGVAVPVAVWGMMIWAIASRLSGLLIQTRLYMSFFPAFAMLAGGGYLALTAIRLPGVRLGRVAGSLVVLALGLNAIQLGLETLSRQTIETLTGQRLPGDYLAANLGWIVAADQAIGELPEDARVILLWEPRSLYCLPRCDPDEVLDRWLVDWDANQSAAGVLAFWQAAGYSHLLFNQQGADFVREQDSRYTTEHWQALEDLLANLPPPREIGGGYQLYSLEP